MTNYQYLIIGGGMRAAATVDGIRQVDSTGGIGLISAELDAPYDPSYLQKDRVRDVLLWNVWEQVEAAPPIDRRSRSVHSHEPQRTVAG